MEVKSSQGKYWCFTNYELEIDYSKWGASYVIWGTEICPKTEKVHHQGYVEFKSNQRFTAMKKRGEKIHWELRKGSQEDAIKYCEKDGKFEEIGNPAEIKQGKRNDIEEVKNLVRNGKGMSDIVEVANSYQSLKFAENMIKYKECKRNWETEVYWYYGKTGTGKTKLAFEEAGDKVWVSGKNLKWWDGYDAHENVIFDDFRGDFCTFHELLRILDRYPYTIETKGGTRQLLAKKIWVTCPYRPEEVYNKNSEEIGQLLRRIKLIKEFGIGTGMEVGGNTRPLQNPIHESIHLFLEKFESDCGIVI